jgi:hypothetical protein
LYKIAYENSQRSLDDQVEELNGVRQRVGQYIAFVGSATAFLVGAGVRSPARDWVFYSLAGVATFVSICAIILTCLVLLPVKRWEYRLSTQDLIDGWIETDVPPPSEAHVVRYLGELYDEMRTSNDTALAYLRRFYVAAVATGSLQIVLWACLAWARA